MAVKRTIEISNPSPTKKQKIESPDPALDSASDTESDEGYSVKTPATPFTPVSRSSTPACRQKRLPCPFQGCDKLYNRPARLEEHIRSHTGERPFKCTFSPCDKAFLRQSHLSHHIKSAHTNEKDYVCDRDGCDKAFSTATRLKRHTKTHDDNEQFTCRGYPGCNRVFRKHITLQQHIDSDHLGLAAFPCTHNNEETGLPCDEKFYSARHLSNHVTREHGELRHWCSLCPSSNEDTPEKRVGFRTHSELQAHLAEQHPPQCEHCSKTFASTRELDRHIDIHHDRVPLAARRTFICTVEDCGKGFTKQGNLNIHVKTVHAKNKPFVCGTADLSAAPDLMAWTGDNACGMAFGTRATLEGHVRTKHLRKENEPALNKKQMRQMRKSKAAMEAQPTTFARLTGAGYAEESGRDIPCVMQNCAYLFKRMVDLEMHAKNVHNIGEDEVQDILAENEALQGGQFWLGGTEPVHRPEEEADLEWEQYVNLAAQDRSTDDVSKSVATSAVDRKQTSFSDLDFQALVDYCAPGEDVDPATGTVSTLVDPAMV